MRRDGILLQDKATNFIVRDRLNLRNSNWDPQKCMPRKCVLGRAKYFTVEYLCSAE